MVIVGGGAIGLSCAWWLARAGTSVTVVDPAFGSGATRAAAGMLAPVTEVHATEHDLAAANIASSRRWGDFAAALEEASGVDIGYRACGTLVVSKDPGDREVLSDLVDLLESWGLTAERLSASESRKLEPMLSPGLSGGMFASGDHQVDPRAFHSALMTAAQRAGANLLTGEVVALERSGESVVGPRLKDGQVLGCDVTIVAAGAWSGRLELTSVSTDVEVAIPEGGPSAFPVRPVKGHVLRLRSEEGRSLLSRNVRAFVGGRRVYLVPRIDGTLVVGATVEEKGFDLSVQAGPVSELLEDARQVLPGTSELSLEECVTGLRPGSPDNGPMIGPLGPPGLLLASGHYRNGILLSPLTADAVCAFVRGGEVPAELRPFAADRFLPRDRSRGQAASTTLAPGLLRGTSGSE